MQGLTCLYEWRCTFKWIGWCKSTIFYMLQYSIPQAHSF